MKLTLNKMVGMMLVAGTASLASSAALAHITYIQKDAYLTQDGRSYKEGTSATLALNLSHACTPTTGTVISTSVFPVGADTEVYDLTINQATNGVTADPAPSATKISDVLTADAVSGIKPSVDGDWEKIVPKKDANGKVRAMHWHHGWVPDNHFEALEYRASFAKFKPDTCYSKVRVYIPASQFCADTKGGDVVASHWWAWAGIPDVGVTANPIPAGFTKAVGYASFIDINRDLTNNPLPKYCGASNYNEGDIHNLQGQSRPGQVLGIYPSVDSMKSYGPHVVGGPVNVSDCPAGTTLVHDMATMTNSCVAVAP